MKPDEIQELLSFIASSGLDEVNIETDKFKLAVKRAGAPAAAPAVQYVQMPPAMAGPAPAPAMAGPAAAPQAAPAAAAPSANTKTIKSPMIGTFYSSSKPGEPEFVQIGSEVKQGQVVCIIEAMKLFNEIESEFSGKIVKILVENATPVEYDQPLFLVEA